jgi:hypothetical protein
LTGKFVFQNANFLNAINSRVHQTCVFSQSERLLSSNQKCLSWINRLAALSSVKSMLRLSDSQIVFNNCVFNNCIINKYIIT